MNIKAKFLAAAFSFTVLGGGAFAGALDVIDPINQQSFYTSSIRESTHTDPVMRSKFRAALKTLPHSKRERCPGATFRAWS